MGMNIAIDGPAGAGKSTIAKKLAQDLGFIYIDTGAMYRSIALYFMEHGIAADNQSEMEKACENITVTIRYEDGEQQVILNGENVNGRIRKEEVSRMASVTSAYPFVREKLTQLQRSLAEEENVIMDGRDIGTCVLPGAQVKIYLTASVKTRAQRRYKEQSEKGEQVSLSAIEEDIRERDYRDMHRESAPLKQAEDAVLVDTSALTIEQAVEKIKEIYEEKK